MAILLSILCSPKIGGFTEALLRETLHGVREVSGVEIDEIFLPDYQFQTCRACYSCTRSSKHTCVLDDEMGKNGEGELFLKLNSANGLLLANPTYLCSLRSPTPSAYGSANALCHLFFERCYPFIWSDTLNGMPFASVTSAYNIGFHRLADREICRWAFTIKFRHIGSLPIHSVHFEKSKPQLRQLGRDIAEATLRDAREGRKKFTEEERFLYYMDKPWTALEPYFDNLTFGTFQWENSLTQLGFAEGWFSDPDAIKDFETADEELKAAFKHYEEGNLVEANRMLAKASVTWKRATGREYHSRKK